MGNSTIIEINHDQAHEIEEDRIRFAEVVLMQCRAAEYTGQRIPGGRIIAFFHRSGPVYDAWIDFKHKWFPDPFRKVRRD